MTTPVFINVCVEDLPHTNHFFQAPGFRFKEKFSNDIATWMILNTQAFVMLLTQPFFSQFVRNPISDAHRQTEVLLAISVESRAAVDAFIEHALSMGANEARDTQDMERMYSRAFHDLDGHIWEVGWMDPAIYN
ncbi:MAG: VOC family protein [Bacteroidota bacterium]